MKQLENFSLRINYQRFVPFYVFGIGKAVLSVNVLLMDFSFIYSLNPSSFFMPNPSTHFSARNCPVILWIYTHVIWSPYLWVAINTWKIHTSAWMSVVVVFYLFLIFISTNLFSLTSVSFVHWQLHRGGIGCHRNLLMVNVMHYSGFFFFCSC